MTTFFERSILVVMILLSVTSALIFSSEKLVKATTNNSLDSLSSYADGCTITTKNAPLYDIHGKESNRSLKLGTSWFTDKQLVLNDEIYYRVSANEFVNSKDAYLYRTNVENIKVYTKTPAQLYDHTGRPLDGRKVQPNSVWYSDRSVSLPNLHESFMRISTDEWIALGDADSIN